MPNADAGRTPGIMHFAPAWQHRASEGFAHTRLFHLWGLESKEGCWSDSNVLCRTLLDLVRFQILEVRLGPIRSRQDPSDRHGSIWVHCVIPRIPLGDGSCRLGFRLGFHQNRDRTRHDRIEGCLHRFLYPSIIPPGGGQGFGVQGFGLFLGFLGRPDWSSPHSYRRRPGILLE